MVRNTDTNIEIVVKNAEGDPDTKATIIHQNSIDYEPKVSVIIPVYNTEEYLRECLDSVVNQTLKEIEIICVDDGSTDNSLEILKEYANKDNRFTIVKQENMGSGTARNCGLNISKGVFVAFMDGDDCYPKSTTLDSLCFKAYENKVLVVGGSVIKFNSETGNIDPNSYEPEYIFKKEKIIYYDEYQFDYGYWRFIYNRRLLVDNRIFFPNLLRQQDPPFFIKAMSLAEKFYAIPEQTYAYRVSYKQVKWDEKKSLSIFKGVSLSLELCKQYCLYNLYCKIAKRINSWTFRTALSESLKYASVRNEALKTLKSIDYDILNSFGIEMDFDDIYKALLKAENNNVIVSVIVPIYNVEKYLKRCLDSLIYQTFPCIEILCIDDGSTDNSRKIVEEYCKKDERVRLLCKKNGGLSSARNYGLKYAKGSYVNFVDSDDWIALETLEKAMSKMSGNIDVVCWGAQLVNDGIDKNNQGFIIGNDYHKIKIVGQRSMSEDVILNTTYTVWNKLFKLDILKKYDIKFLENRLFEDNDFTIIYFSHCINGFFLPDYMYYYAQRPNSIMERVRAGKCEKTIDNLYIFDSLYKHLKKYNLLEKYKKVLSHRFYIHLNAAYKYAPYMMKNDVIRKAKLFSKKYSEEILGNDVRYLKKGEIYKIRHLNHIIVSLTSYPKRINTVCETLESLLAQTLKANEIILWLAKEQFPNLENDLPASLLNLRDKGISIKWCSDIKSYKKLIPCLKEFKNSIIITADDDLIYPKNNLESLYKTYIENNKNVICHRAHYVKVSKDNKRVLSYNAWEKDTKNIESSYFLFPTTGAMVLYPPNSFNDTVFNEKVFMELARTNDDIWFWAMLVLNKKKIQLAKNNNSYLNFVNDTQDVGLWLSENKHGGNDLSLNLILEKYPQIIRQLNPKNSFLKKCCQTVFSVKNEPIRKQHKIITILGLKFKIKRKACGEYSFIENIFSVKNKESRDNKWYKVITILGVKFKFRNKSKEQQKRFEELAKNIRDIKWQCDQHRKNAIENQKLINSIVMDISKKIQQVENNNKQLIVAISDEINNRLAQIEMSNEDFISNMQNDILYNLDEMEQYNEKLLYSISNEFNNKIIQIENSNKENVRTTAQQNNLSIQVLKEEFNNQKNILEKLPNKSNISNVVNSVQGMLNRTKQKPYLTNFVVDIASHCNLNCKGCDHFSPLAEPAFYDLEQYKKDIACLSKLTRGNIDRVGIMGGEPLLNPDVLEYLKITRQYFPKTKIRLVTNGILLSKQSEEFWLTLKELNIFIEYTKYDLKLDYDYIDSVIKKYGVPIDIYGYNQNIIKTSYKIPLDLEGNQNPCINFLNCFHANNCITLKNGKIYTCTVAPNIEHFNKHFGYDIPLTERDGIDIYKAKSVEEILEFISKPIPFCKYCNVNGRTFGHKWEISKKDINEWT